jgi:hypothetical protein
MDYALDANVFIEAARRYYAFAICPGFWQSLVHHHGEGHIFSIDRVKEEMADKGDELATWVADQVLDACFESSDTEAITVAYAQLVGWVNAQDQFSAAAKTQFAEKADAWLIAYAKATGKCSLRTKSFGLKPKSGCRFQMSVRRSMSSIATPSRC